MNQNSQLNQVAFDVRFEAVGYTSVDLDGTEISEEEARGFTETATAERSLPNGVNAVVRANISEDDAQSPDDRKVFVCVTLRVMAQNETAAQNFTAPVDLLTRVADMMSTTDEGDPLDLINSWEVADVEPAE